MDYQYSKERRRKDEGINLENGWERINLLVSTDQFGQGRQHTYQRNERHYWQGGRIQDFQTGNFFRKVSRYVPHNTIQKSDQSKGTICKGGRLCAVRHEEP